MTKRIVIIGVGSFANLMYYYLRQENKRQVVAFSVNREYIKTEMYNALPVYPLEELANICSVDSHEVIIAIGTTNMNQLRKRLFNECKNMGYNIASFIHPSCVISPDIIIGEGNIILEKNLIQPFVHIGNGNLFWDNISITHNDIIGDFNTLSGGVGLSGFTTIQNNCYLGKYSMVFDKVNVANFTLIGAGAYVKKDTQPYDVIVPARSVTLEGKKSTDFNL